MPTPSGTRCRMLRPIISAVNCSASVSKYVAQRFDAAALKDYANVDGVIALTHSGGCGIQFLQLVEECIPDLIPGGRARVRSVGCDQHV